MRENSRKGGETESVPNLYANRTESGGEIQSVPVKSFRSGSNPTDFSGMGSRLDSSQVKSVCGGVTP